jgi:hypothetical protein
MDPAAQNSYVSFFQTKYVKDVPKIASSKAENGLFIYKIADKSSGGKSMFLGIQQLFALEIQNVIKNMCWQQSFIYTKLNEKVGSLNKILIINNRDSYQPPT